METISNQNDDIAVVVFSCDRYADLWHPFFTLFFRYWPDCPYPVYLISNFREYEDPRVRTILTGSDADWSSTVRKGLAKIPHSRILLLEEDYLLYKQVDSEGIRELSRYMTKHGAGCLRLFPSPKPNRQAEDNSRVGRILKKVRFRVSLQAALWQKDLFLSLLRDGESPWEFEFKGSRRSDAIDSAFFSVINEKDSPIPYFCTAVVEGKWRRDAIRLCRNEGVRVDLHARPSESRRDYYYRTRIWPMKEQIKERYFSGKLNFLSPYRIKKGLRHLLGMKNGPGIQNYFGTPILSPQEGNDLIAQLLLGDRPLMISRFGATEMSCLRNYLRVLEEGGPWGETRIGDLSGLFPVTEEMLNRFSALVLDNLKLLDVLGVWYLPGEAEFFQHYGSQARLVQLKALEPYYHQNPWSKALQGRKVLIVHPFQQSIESQYHSKREQLFRDPDVLPRFNLMTVKAVQSLVRTPTGFDNWFEALDHMCREIKQKDFDIAIIGAGAYGMPLAAFVKSLGKKAIHMGGATQILFGIKGKRWEEYPEVSRFFNEHWSRPLREETPPNYLEVEKGCYW